MNRDDHTTAISFFFLVAFVTVFMGAFTLFIVGGWKALVGAIATVTIVGMLMEGIR